jgi:putative chitinase
MSLAITVEHLAAIAGRTTTLMPDLVEWLNRLCPLYEIDLPQEYCHFLAQACHETDHFKTLREYASGNAYEGREDLGNTQPGDGVRFKGRGIFQTTGRANYLELGIKKGRRDMFVDSPELLEQPEYAVWSACEYWKTRGLNDIANHADSDVLKKKYKGAVLDLSPVEYISYRINGGNRGLDERKKFYSIAQRVLTEPAAPRLVRGRVAVRKRVKKRNPSMKRTSTRSRRKMVKTSPASKAKPARASHRKR